MLKKKLGYERGNRQLGNDIKWYIYENKSIYDKKKFRKFEQRKL